MNNIADKIRKMTPAEKQANLKMLDYIKMLAAQTKKDISTWNIMELFAADGTHNLITDKKQINTIFFKQMEPKKDVATGEIQEAVAVEAPLPAIDDTPVPEFDFSGVSQTLRKTYASLRDSSSKTHTQRINDYAKNRDYYLSEAENCNNLLLKEQQKLDLLLNQDGKAPKEDKLITDLKKILQQKLWTNPVLDGNFLYLNTAHNIKIQDAKTKKHVDMGQYAVRIDLANGLNLQVLPYKNNLFIPQGHLTTNQYHPHIQPKGSICWGGASTLSYNYQKDGELDKLLVLLHALLSNYSEGGGYDHPSDFEKKGKKNIELAAHFVHPDFKKK